jgi:hypothetical protein
MASVDAAVAPPTPATVSNDLFDHPDWIGETVTFEVYEGMYDDAHSSGAPKGGYDVQVVDIGAKRLQLAPESPGKRLPALRSPVRVTGKLTAFEHGLRVLVRDTEQLEFPKPERLASASELTKDPARWARKMVEVEDTLTTGFEISKLGDTFVWLDGYPEIKVTCEPKRPSVDRLETRTARVRVVGRAYTAGRHYGHLSMYSAKIDATELVFLDPNRPECK